MKLRLAIALTGESRPENRGQEKNLDRVSSAEVWQCRQKEVQALARQKLTKLNPPISAASLQPAGRDGSIRPGRSSP